MLKEDGKQQQNVILIVDLKDQLLMRTVVFLNTCEKLSVRMWNISKHKVQLICTLSLYFFIFHLTQVLQSFLLSFFY